MLLEGVTLMHSRRSRIRQNNGAIECDLRSMRSHVDLQPRSLHASLLSKSLVSSADLTADIQLRGNLSDSPEEDEAFSSSALARRLPTR